MCEEGVAYLFQIEKKSNTIKTNFYIKHTIFSIHEV